MPALAVYYLITNWKFKFSKNENQKQIESPKRKIV